MYNHDCSELSISIYRSLHLREAFVYSCDVSHLQALVETIPTSFSALGRIQFHTKVCVAL